MPSYTAKYLGILAPVMVFSLLSLFILRDVLSPGLLITLDSTYAYYRDPMTYYGVDERWITAGTPLYVSVAILKGIAPLWLIERFFLCATFAVGGLGAYRIVPTSLAGKYLAGIIYVANPYTYERFIAGHWSLLSAYALTPFAMGAFLNLLHKRDMRSALFVALTTTLVAMFSMHQLVILFAMYSVSFIIWIIKKDTFFAHLRSLIVPILLAACFFLFINLYWIFPTITAPTNILDEIDQDQLAVFATRGFSSWGDLFDAVTLYGFWRVSPTVERPDSVIHLVSFLPILFLAVHAVFNAFNVHVSGRVITRRTIVAILLIGVIGFVAAIESQILNNLWHQIPVVRGFREPQKFLGALAFSYAFLAGLGLGTLHQQLSNWNANANQRLSRFIIRTFPILVLLLPLGFSFHFFTTVGRQIEVTDYPAEWIETRKIVHEGAGSLQTLVLPWQHYMWYPWLPNAEKKMANPARRFFETPVIMGDSLGIGVQDVLNPMSRYVDTVLKSEPQDKDLGASVIPLGVKYIVLFRTNISEYDRIFLADQTDLIERYSGESIILYENTHSVSRFYSVPDSQESLKTREELVALDYISMSPIDFKTELVADTQIGFVPPQNSTIDGWALDNLAREDTLWEFLPVFDPAVESAHLTYPRYGQVYIPVAFISGFSFVMIVGFLLISRMRQYRD
ncbi:hypothetical protein M1N17_00905 [Dehalococcoidia bacterium]|nr:hypothetical protein [Dehalococcoidia bacterium]